MIKRPMGNQMIFYNNVFNQYPNQATELPVDSEYNIPGWGIDVFEELKLQSESSVWCFDFSYRHTFGRMEYCWWNEMRLDVEHNDMKLVQPYETPQGEV